MKFIAAIDVNLDHSPIGTASRFGDELLGQTILARTVARVARASRLRGVFVLCPAEQQARCAELIRRSAAAIRTYTVGPPPYRQLVRAVRKWSLDGWRGGMGGSCVMDEYMHVPVLAGLARQEAADAVVVIPGPAPLIDPALIDAMIEHFRTVSDDTRMTLAQTPPGLSPVVFQAGLLDDLAGNAVPPGWTMSYKPDRPEMDPVFRKCCFHTPRPLRHSSGRLIADTRRALETIHEYLAQHEYTTAEHVGEWLIDREARAAPHLPREVEIELTTDDLPSPSGESAGNGSGVALRPRVGAAQRRGPIDPALVQTLADELSAYDDALVVLGGFGEPLAHPQFGDIVRHLREAGIYGLAVRTNGVGLDDAAIAALTESRTDVVSVALDAWTPELYRRLHGRDLQPVLDAMERLFKAREQKQQVEPLIVPEMIKSVQTVNEMDAFFDGWFRKYGWATLVGYSTYAGLLPDHRVMDMSPPVRLPCRRIRSRCMVLADGRVLACDQDFTPARPLGRVGESSLSNLWHGPAMKELRAHHDAGRFDADPLCAACSEWHRP